MNDKEKIAFAIEALNIAENRFAEIHLKEQRRAPGARKISFEGERDARQAKQELRIVTDEETQAVSLDLVAGDTIYQVRNEHHLDENSWEDITATQYANFERHSHDLFQLRKVKIV